MTSCVSPDCSLETEGQYCEGHRKRDVYLRRTYGMTLKDYYVLLDYQDGKCYLCKRPPRPGENLTVDHDHVSRKVRGLLCTYCNRRNVGRFRDWNLVYDIAMYLKDPPADYAPTSRILMFVISISYGIFALSLWFQGGRWDRTPAYHNLLQIMPQAGWGIVFAVTSGLLGAAVRKYGQRWVSVIALMVAFAVTTGWGGDFVVRWLTNADTTPVTWVSWGVFDFMLMMAAAKLDVDEVCIPRFAKKARDD